jgi:hypothetical protein
VEKCSLRISLLKESFLDLPAIWQTDAHCERTTLVSKNYGFRRMTKKEGLKVSPATALL